MIAPPRNDLRLMTMAYAALLRSNACDIARPADPLHALSAARKRSWAGARNVVRDTASFQTDIEAGNAADGLGDQPFSGLDPRRVLALHTARSRSF